LDVVRAVYRRGKTLQPPDLWRDGRGYAMSRTVKRRANELQIAVARRLSSLRQARGLTQEGVADRLGIASQNIQRIESGRQNLTLQTIERVAGAIGVATEDVLHVTAGPGARPRFLELERGGVLRPSVEPPVPVPVFRLVDGARFARAGRPMPLGWMLLADDVEPGSFIVRVEGSAMEPRVPDGAWSLFRPLRQKEPQAKSFVLLALGAGDDVEVLVRRVDAAPDAKGRITLSTLQPGEAPLVLGGPDEGQILAEHVRTVSLDA
jgi:transcriptional regulator with XRE-family HTH domain